MHIIIDNDFLFEISIILDPDFDLYFVPFLPNFAVPLTTNAWLYYGSQVSDRYIHIMRVTMVDI